MQCLTSIRRRECELPERQVSHQILHEFVVLFFHPHFPALFSGKKLRKAGRRTSSAALLPILSPRASRPILFNTRCPSPLWLFASPPPPCGHRGHRHVTCRDRGVVLLQRGVVLCWPSQAEAVSLSQASSVSSVSTAAAAAAATTFYD